MKAYSVLLSFIYVDANIETLGESRIGLSDLAPNVTAVHVQNEN